VCDARQVDVSVVHELWDCLQKQQESSQLTISTLVRYLAEARAKLEEYEEQRGRRGPTLPHSAQRDADARALPPARAGERGSLGSNRADDDCYYDDDDDDDDRLAS
jgi:hypothetical protein